MSRRDIYYWKCDRPAAFHGTLVDTRHDDLAPQLTAALRDHFGDQSIVVASASGQGNHATFRATIARRSAFIRVEDGPEHDDYIEVESHVLGQVRALGLPAPQVLAVDASRTRAPFAWQVLEDIPHPDLNQLLKRCELDLAATARELGAAVARWQQIAPTGFGPFDPATLRRTGQLGGFHASYADYFHLHLDRHLRFLEQRGFLTLGEADEMRAAIEAHRSLLALERGFLVHKDLALWNVLGTATEIAAFIDWDDAIAGDPMDDLSLLGCFHDGAILARALDGYVSVRPLPADHRRRFWLHLLRNMIVKAVIRVGAGYFDRTDGFYLIASGSSGADLRAFTHDRLSAALRGLRTNQPIETL